MNRLSLLLVISIFYTLTIFGSEPNVFNTKWIPEKPEVLTYKSNSPQGNGMYQVSVYQKNEVITCYINIITTGFTKTVSGEMTSVMKPVASNSKIFIDNQIALETVCTYGKESLHIVTDMKPYNQRTEENLSFTDIVIDFSQLPLIPRTLSLQKDTKYSYSSLNPQTNKVVPFTLEVIGEEVIGGIECFKIESNDFEGKSFLWIEKNGAHTILRIEQPATKRITELIR